MDGAGKRDSEGAERGTGERKKREISEPPVFKADHRMVNDNRMKNILIPLTLIG